MSDKQKCPECAKEYKNLAQHMKSHRKEYKAVALIMGKKFEGKGETIYEAIGNIRPGGIAGRVILTVSCGDSTKDRILPLQRARRIFNTLGLTREVALKQISDMFDGV